MLVNAIASVESGSAILTFSSNVGATVKLVVAFLSDVPGAGSPLIANPFRVEPLKPLSRSVSEGLARLLGPPSNEVKRARVTIDLSLDTRVFEDSSQSGQYRVAYEKGTFTEFGSA